MNYLTCSAWQNTVKNTFHQGHVLERVSNTPTLRNRLVIINVSQPNIATSHAPRYGPISNRPAPALTAGIARPSFDQELVTQSSPAASVLRLKARLSCRSCWRARENVRWKQIWPLHQSHSTSLSSWQLSWRQWQATRKDGRKTLPPLLRSVIPMTRITWMIRKTSRDGPTDSQPDGTIPAEWNGVIVHTFPR